MKPILGVLILAGALASCAVAPPRPAPHPTNSESSAIGVVVGLRAPLGFPTYDADMVFLARVEGGQYGPDDQVVASNYSKDGRVYVLNVPPGEYAIVAASFRLRGLLDDGSTYLTLLDARAVKETQTTVEPGRLHSLGALAVDMHPFVCSENSDAMQLRFAELIAPGMPKCGFGSLIGNALQNGVYVSGRFYSTGSFFYPYRGSLEKRDRGESSVSAFEAQALRDLDGTGWESWLRRSDVLRR